MFLLTKSLDVGPKAKLIALQFPVSFSNLTKYFNLTIYQFPVLWRSDIWHRYTVNILRPTGFRLLLSISVYFSWRQLEMAAQKCHFENNIFIIAVWLFRNWIVPISIGILFTSSRPVLTNDWRLTLVMSRDWAASLWNKNVNWSRGS